MPHPTRSFGPSPGAPAYVCGILSISAAGWAGTGQVTGGYGRVHIHG